MRHRHADHPLRRKPRFPSPFIANHHLSRQQAVPEIQRPVDIHDNRLVDIEPFPVIYPESHEMPVDAVDKVLIFDIPAGHL